MVETLDLTQEWDKTFPKSGRVDHRKVTFHNRYGITLAADLYQPKGASGKLAAIAVCGPFGAVKEQAAVDLLSVQENVDPERIGIISICGWGRHGAECGGKNAIPFDKLERFFRTYLN